MCVAIKLVARRRKAPPGKCLFESDSDRGEIREGYLFYLFNRIAIHTATTSQRKKPSPQLPDCIVGVALREGADATQG
jgi:hypothetical protein